ncbi:hypothetical protein tb265_11990 [Gemmatimonadetes bacterium T265]|nr:hypothetical protein tb265_11990 [Gemmatimonadetes bacterium T265]
MEWKAQRTHAHRQHGWCRARPFSSLRLRAVRPDTANSASNDGAPGNAAPPLEFFQAAHKKFAALVATAAPRTPHD